jgi:hypothetical protein
MDTTTNQSQVTSCFEQSNAVINLLTVASRISVTLRCDEREVKIELQKHLLDEIRAKQPHLMQTLKGQMERVLLSYGMLDLIQQVDKSLSTNTGLGEVTSKSASSSASPCTE